jgi:hypothetical protein
MHWYLVKFREFLWFHAHSMQIRVARGVLLLLLTACGGGSPAQSASSAPSASASPASVRSEAEWNAHCEAVAKHRLSCGNEVEEESGLMTAICKKTRPCAETHLRREAVPLLFECEEKGECDEPCTDVVAAALPPWAGEARVERACLARFPGEDFECTSVARSVHLANDAEIEKTEACIAKVKDALSATLCGTVALAPLACMRDSAPNEMAKALAPPEFPERKSVATFGKGLPVALGAEPPKTKRDIHAWTYADVPMRVTYEPAKGKVQEIRFEPVEPTRDSCRELSHRAVADLGSPTRASNIFGPMRTWKGSDRVVAVDVVKRPDTHSVTCTGTIAAKDSPTWKRLVK